MIGRITGIAAAFLLMIGAERLAAQQARHLDPADAIAACRAIDTDAARLACFDQASDRLTAARSTGDLVVLDRRTVVERRRKAFGLPSAATLAAADVRGAEVKSLNGTVRAVMPTRTPGRYTLQLTDGSMWETLDPTPTPKADATIAIEAVRLGGFRAKIDKRRAIMVKRVR